MPGEMLVDKAGLIQMNSEIQTVMNTCAVTFQEAVMIIDLAIKKEVALKTLNAK